MDKENVVFTYIIEYYSALKKGNAAMCNMINLDSIMLSEISQTEKDRYCIVSLICALLKKRKVKLIETE